MLKVHQYLELKTLDINNFKSKIDFMVQFVSVFYDLDSELIENYPISKLTQLFNDIKIDIKPKAVDSIIIIDQPFHKIPFNKLSLGEWIDLDHYIKNDNILEIITTLYRIKNSGGLFNEDEFEEYGFFSNKRTKYFNETNAEDVISVVNEYINWKNIVIKSYSGLFITQDSDDDDYTGLNSKEIAELKQAIEEDKKQQQFVWERIVMELVNNDLSKFNEVLKLPVIQVFNILSMIKLKK